MKYLYYYFFLISVVSFITMGIDKRRSVCHRWRIPERMLFFMAISGGSLGILLGMWIFWHKVRNKMFVIGIPLILILQLVLYFMTVHGR